MLHRTPFHAVFASISLLLLLSCDQPTPVDPNAVTLDACTFRPMTPTANEGGQVQAGLLTAGAAEQVLDVPVGTALGAYTRVGFRVGQTDEREVPFAGAFAPSVGIEAAPRVKALALTAGGETVLIVKVDVGLMVEELLFGLEERLGRDFAGKVILAASHSHSAWGQQSGHSGLEIGNAPFRREVYDAFLSVLEATAREALDAQRPAQLGVFVDRAFDPSDALSRDRRSENDELMGGPRKDDTLVMIRVDGADGNPIAVLPIYGVHGTLNDSDNHLASTDVTGGLERVLQEQFDDPVVVMHLQGAAGDVSPRGYGSLDCGLSPGLPDDACHEWLAEEGYGRVAAPVMMAAWERAGDALVSELELEMVTRSIALGPDAETFTIRDGALRYAPFDVTRVADGYVYDDDGAVLSPIDEFNAPVGAALCETGLPLVRAGAMPGTTGLAPYGSCLRVDVAARFIGAGFGIDFETDATHPVCESTRTVVSALRLGEYVLGTLPGEPTVMIADLVREQSPVAPDHTIVVGYAQGHTGYLLRPEDWLRGGFEPTVGFWGPLEGEYLAEQLAALWPLVMSPEREDATRGAAPRVMQAMPSETFPADVEPPMAGTIPPVVPANVWLRSGPATSAQPNAEVPRVSGLARFVWRGDDPLHHTPRVTLEREVSAGVFAPALRRSGRPVSDSEVVVTYTPMPLVRVPGEAQTHYWAVEWQPVPWLGARDDVGASLDTLDTRAALPLGRYRFHVEGAAFDIVSDPFEVVPATLDLRATRDMDTGRVTLTVALNAPQGYRLMDLELPSNRPVPLRNAALRVVLTHAPSPDTVLTLTTDALGQVTFDAPGAPILAVQVTDAYDNHGSRVGPPGPP
ncbi:MAG: neutral/alkaline non-lysosomal ceramidase N-terminal domain-containing protein [Sandaracinaceae bacterium]|nr:neutral/alkaline non-lysosomal ceramidase N-terminal domain-containing protein [Sandaracinaceae bacterium]